MAKWLSVVKQCSTLQWQRLGSCADTLQCFLLHLRKPTILGRSFATHYVTSVRQKNKLQVHYNSGPLEISEAEKDPH